MFTSTSALFFRISIIPLVSLFHAKWWQRWDVGKIINIEKEKRRQPVPYINARGDQIIEKKHAMYSNKFAAAEMEDELQAIDREICKLQEELQQMKTYTEDHKRSPLRQCRGRWMLGTNIFRCLSKTDLDSEH
ncbi:hypothetical protein SK128_024964 [Halocaridina rubra]|uniref:Uncharacterized protein n=1 Tax=Halocaridina rubra TaxID=373956 RepID=A0AAN8X533_HALRR